MARKTTPKTWAQKFQNAKAPHVAILEKPFGGVPAGGSLYVASPAVVADYAAAVPVGQTRTVNQMRSDLAAREGAMATCPTSTSFFVRIAAEAALEELAAGKAAAAVTPFWRIVDPDGPMAAKLSCGGDFIRTMRAVEAG